uniref:hypothetical protein n=1 Tax=Castellaniella defragrans TaxID=75697 RepID=UPI00334105C2
MQHQEAVDLAAGADHHVTGAEATRYLYAAVSPHRGSTYEEQLAEAVGRIVDTFASQGGKVVRQTVFLREPGRAADVARLLRAHYGAGAIPVTSYVNQPPCDARSLIAIEAAGVAGGGVSIEYRSPQLTVVRHDGIAWVHTDYSAAHDGGQAADAYDTTLRALRATGRLLQSANARPDQVFRTWFYMGGILADEAGGAVGTQRYKELNRARTDVFQDVDFLADRVPGTLEHSVYPASTGIGMAGADVGLSAIALVTDRQDVLAVPLENPRQIAAFDYGRHYSPQSPKFSRAMALIHDGQATIHVSGTASITASETRHLGDVARQAEETLLNITALIGEENLAAHGFPGFGAQLWELGVVRAYIKRLQDYPAVRAICERELGAIPVIYTVGDVCRDDLLVEMEGVVHTRKPAASAA